MSILLLGISIGIFLPYILSSNDILIGIDAVNYYGEVHTSYLNSMVHTIFMPFTIYGMLLWIPKVFNLNINNSIKLQNLLYTFYMTHYFILNYKIGLLTSLYYYIPLYYASKKYLLEYNNYVPIKGFFISFMSLTIQEVFGHWLGGDNPSRVEAIPNAILYAMYYSVHHLFV